MKGADILDPDMFIPGESRRKKQAKKLKMNPGDQRLLASNQPRQSFKDLPRGWSRDKVGIKNICATLYMIYRDSDLLSKEKT